MSKSCSLLGSGGVRGLEYPSHRWGAALAVEDAKPASSERLRRPDGVAGDGFRLVAHRGATSMIRAASAIARGAVRMTCQDCGSVRDPTRRSRRCRRRTATETAVRAGHCSAPHGLARRRARPAWSPWRPESWPSPTERQMAALGRPVSHAVIFRSAPVCFGAK